MSNSKKFEKFEIWKYPKIVNLESYKNVQFENSKKFLNFTISKIFKFLKLYYLEKQKIFKILQFGKLLKFHEFLIL